jgi:hypothetical protein
MWERLVAESGGRRKWVLFEPPATLKEVVDQISKQEVSKLGARP